MLKIEELKSELADKKSEAQKLLDAGNMGEAKKALAKCHELKSEIDNLEMQASIDNIALDDVPEVARAATPASKIKEAANFVRAAIKKMAGKPLTETENALLLPSTEVPDGDNGESFILPVEVQTRIREKKRQLKSIRAVIGVEAVGALTGSFPVENIDSLQGLVDFADGDDGEKIEAKDIKFEAVKFSLQEKAAFISLSNTLLTLTDEDLLNRIAVIFAKKAVITENSMGFTALRKDKDAKEISTYEDLRGSLIEDIDPAAEENTIITTNQSGFKWLCAQKYPDGTPIMGVDASDPRKKVFDGHPVEVFSNTQLPNTDAGKAPVFYGDTVDGVLLLELNKLSFASSAHAGFWRNTTVARIIEFIDVVQADKSDACYCYGLIDLNTVATADAGEAVEG